MIGENHIVVSVTEDWQNQSFTVQVRLPVETMQDLYSTSMRREYIHQQGQSIARQVEAALFEKINRC
jgi:hypothetical protein